MLGSGNSATSFADVGSICVTWLFGSGVVVPGMCRTVLGSSAEKSPVRKAAVGTVEM